MEVVGEFEAGSTTGLAVVMVVRQCGARDYLAKVRAVRDPFWSWHLRESGRLGDPVLFRLANGTAADQEQVAGGNAIELLTDWRCLCSEDVPVDAECVRGADWLDKERVPGI